MFNEQAPTTLMLGRYQPFHDGHLELFKEALKKTGQVLIAVRDTHGTDEKNPFDFNYVKSKIDEKLTEYVGLYKVVLLPNITNIVYGRDVGYLIEKISLSSEIENISATDIRKQLLKDN